MSFSDSTLEGGGNAIREKTDFNFIFAPHPVANGNDTTQSDRCFSVSADITDS